MQKRLEIYSLSIGLWLLKYSKKKYILNSLKSSKKRYHTFLSGGVVLEMKS